MNLYSIPTLISFLAMFFLALLVLYQGHEYFANKAFALAISSVCVMEFGNFMALNFLYTHKLIFWTRISLVGCCLIPANWSLFSLVFARSHYEKISRRSKLILIIIYIILFAFIFFIPSDFFIRLPDPALGKPNIIMLGKIGYIFNIFVLLVIVFILINLETVYRNSTGIKKWQIKYSILGMFAAFTFYVYVISKIILFRFVDLYYIPIGSMVILICSGLLAFSFIRNRLMNIDIFISRQVAYGSFTLIAVSTYLILVGFIGQLLKISSINLNKMFYPIFILVSLLTLSVFCLSTNARKKVTRFIDRHFYKNRYDYRNEWIELTNLISYALGLNDLLAKFMELIAKTMCVDEISVWLYDDDDKKFHLLGTRDLPESEMLVNKDSPLIGYLEERDEPFQVCSGKSNDETAKFYKMNKGFFDKFRTSVIAPLMVKDELVGFVTLGKEITGAVYNYEDYDMLKTICHQAANAIMNIKLSDRLVFTKEMDVMNKISSFVLHDLKNSISMLSLIIQNASCNMDNPEFQKDVLDTISKTIGNMKELMGKVSNLPKEIVLNKTRTNIIELIKDCVVKTGLGNDGIELVESYVDSLQVNLDQEKIQSVIRNIIINAQESLKNKGKVSISTFFDDENIIVEIKDNGPGMTKEFLKNKLFKPFQTTKKKGLGIGLYQCKIIIAAHDGKIEVESEEGKGSQFRIFLPIEQRSLKS